MSKETLNQKYLPEMRELAAKARAMGEEEAHIQADRLLVALLKELEFVKSQQCSKKCPNGTLSERERRAR